MESQIMEEATRLFADRGFAGTSLQDIADATGLPEALSKVYDQGRRRVLKEFSSVIGEGVRRRRVHARG
jgi:hypothetical protein